MAKRRQKPFEISPEHRAKIEEITGLLQQAMAAINELDTEAEVLQNHDVYPELMQAIHRSLREDDLYHLTQTLQDAGDSEMRSPK